jgi:pyridoxal phosphate enzyme (YggS family)
MIAERIASISQRIEAACERAGRDPGSVLLVAVSKTHPAEAVREALRAGVRHLGENRHAEAQEKRPLVPEPAEWHFIGRLQTNKAKYFPGLFEWIHSIDRAAAAEAVARAYAKAGMTARVLLQVNVSGEATKAGSDGDAAFALARAAMGLEGLRIEGLMTMAPFEPRPEDTRPVFRATRLLRDRIAAETGLALPHLSMGMTNDFEVAIEEGATMVRLGTAIFGERE